MRYDKAMLERARQLRREMTKQERHLWYDFLQHYPVKIYKQRIIDRFIVDFYCASAKLVIELDGSQHYEAEGIAHDAERTSILETYGLKVIRYSNSDVDNNFYSVCKRIDLEIKERLL